MPDKCRLKDVSKPRLMGLSRQISRDPFAPFPHTYTQTFASCAFWGFGKRRITCKGVDNAETKVDIRWRPNTHAAVFHHRYFCLAT